MSGMEQIIVAVAIHVNGTHVMGIRVLPITMRHTPSRRVIEDTLTIPPQGVKIEMVVYRAISLPSAWVVIHGEIA